MKKIAEFIVKYNKLILGLFAVLIAFSIWGMQRTEVVYSITSYLPASTDTKKALDIMDEEFVTYGSTTILIRNISYGEADELQELILTYDGVKSLPFENTESYYKDSSALFYITFDGTAEDEVCKSAYYDILSLLDGYDSSISAPLIDTYASELAKDVQRILIVVIIIIVAVLLLTSKSVGEVPVFLIVFGVSALLNMGTHFILGKISFISNSVSVILQLALAIDYAIILSHRFAEEKTKNPNPKVAMAEALSKAIPEIFGSSLTTISGLLALCCMQLGLGKDLGLVLAKAIICSMIVVFLLMPTLLLLFNKLIDKTTHRDLVPRITFLGKIIVKLRYVFPVVFLALAVVGCIFTNKITYVYSQNSISTDKPTEAMVAEQQIEEIFGSKNQFVLLVPKDDFQSEQKIIEELKKEEQIDEILAISNVSLTNNSITHTLVDKMNYKDFSDFLGVDTEVGKAIYLAYSVAKDSDSSLSGGTLFTVNPDLYYVSLLEIVDCVYQYDDFITRILVDYPDVLNLYTDYMGQIRDGEDQLIGKNYTRIVINISTAVEAQETFDLITRLEKSIKTQVNGVIFAGNSMASYDLNNSFGTDNMIISILTIVFVFVILIFTLKTWGVPILLVATIQGAIYINFAVPYISGNNLYFFVYLICSAIQMGATIDYAIVITNRYQELIETTDKKTAIIESLNQSFPTILTSGAILVSASFLIANMVSDPLISTLGMALARGTVVSILCVMLVIPCLLYMFYGTLKKTRIPDLSYKQFENVSRKTYKRVKEVVMNEKEKLERDDD